MIENGRRRKIRVTYVIPSLEIGGAETQLVRLINGLDRDRFQPSLICPFGSGPLRSHLEDGVEVISPSLPRLSRLVGVKAAATAVQAVAVMRAYLGRVRPDIVHGYLLPTYTLGAMAAWSVGTKVVIASRRGLDSHRRRTSKSLSLLARLANRVIDYHLCNSEAVRQVAIEDEGIPTSKIGVIYNGIDSPAEPDGVVLPSEWGVGRGGSAAMVANLTDVKRHSDVLEAVKVIVKQRPEFRLVLFGDGDERSAIERLIDKGGLQRNVVLAGARLDAEQLVSAFDLSVLASSREGFPNALMESMARGVPVVATRVGGVPELVRDGVDGKLVEPGRPEQIAAAILELLDAPEVRRRMGEAARMRIRQKFSTRAMTTRTQDLYFGLLNQKDSRFALPKVVHALAWAAAWAASQGVSFVA